MRILITTKKINKNIQILKVFWYSLRNYRIRSVYEISSGILTYSSCSCIKIPSGSQIRITHPVFSDWLVPVPTDPTYTGTFGSICRRGSNPRPLLSPSHVQGWVGWARLVRSNRALPTHRRQHFSSSVQIWLGTALAQVPHKAIGRRVLILSTHRQTLAASGLHWRVYTLPELHLLYLSVGCLF